MKTTSWNVTILLSMVMTGCLNTGGTGPGTPYASCTGRTPEAYRYTDSISCENQRGEWDVFNVHCGTTLNEGCDKVLPASSEAELERVRAQCFRMDGCAVELNNGTRIESPYVGGRCEGTRTPCSALEYPCRQVGCRYNLDLRCEEISGSYLWQNNIRSCAEVQPGSGTNANAAFSLCTRILGCTWVRADGARFDARVNGIPAEEYEAGLSGTGTSSDAGTMSSDSGGPRPPGRP